MAKLLLNSCWGYFCMSTNKSQMKLIRDRSSWNKMLSTDEIEIQNIEIFENYDDYKNDSCLMAFFIKKEEFLNTDKRTNVLLGAMVTAYARMYLYKEMEKLGERTLYTDTDSIFYLTRPKDTYQPIISLYIF